MTWGRSLVFSIPVILAYITRAMTLEPGDIDQWWSSYERFIAHYADLAAAAGSKNRDAMKYKRSEDSGATTPKELIREGTK